MISSNESRRLVMQSGDIFAEPASNARISRSVENSLFCGCCCDFGEAVFLINGFVMALLVLLYLALYGYDEEMCLDSDNNPVDCFDQGVDQSTRFVYRFYLVIGIWFAAIGIYGAIRYNRWAIITVLAFYSFLWLSNAVEHTAMAIFSFSLIFYAHISLI